MLELQVSEVKGQHSATSRSSSAAWWWCWTGVPDLDWSDHESRETGQAVHQDPGPPAAPVELNLLH